MMAAARHSVWSVLRAWLVLAVDPGDSGEAVAEASPVLQHESVHKLHAEALELGRSLLLALERIVGPTVHLSELPQAVNASAAAEHAEGPSGLGGAWTKAQLGQRWVLQCVAEADVILDSLRSVVLRLQDPDDGSSTEEGKLLDKVELRVGSRRTNAVRVSGRDQLFTIMMQSWAWRLPVDVLAAMADL